MKKLLPCPFCQSLRVEFALSNDYMGHVICLNCTARGPYGGEEEVITAWNRLVDYPDIPDWLVRRIKNVTYGYKHAGDGWGYRDGYNDAMEWILSLRRGNTE